MTYNIFDSVSYGFGEPLVPFTKVAEFNTINEVRDFLSKTDKLIKHFVCDVNNNILYDTETKIYESPDNGKTIYERKFYEKERKQIK